jgi:NAD(P)-dependent dehydrogenase (short-subunit alcohol dehydrogenase family)
MALGAESMNQNILITGASRGRGAAMAKAFWEAGANLVLVARNGQTLNDLILKLGTRQGQSAHALPCDLSSPDAVDWIIKSTQQHFDHLDVLINNAAVQGPIGPSWENDWSAWQQALDVNLLAPIDLSRRCAAWMIPQKKGKIICLSGGGATGSRPNFSSYAIAKSGLVRFCEILADELREYHIQVNCISPGAMATALTEEIIKAGPKMASQKEFDSAMDRKEHPENALPDRAVELTLFLASSASDRITGKLISAVWDPWKSLPDHLVDLERTDIYTLRRIVPKDRGKRWGGS